MPSPAPPRWPRWAVAVCLTALLTVQAGFGFQGLANYWQWGHNGFNGAAYHQAARNSLRWGLIFPAQYAAGNRLPQPNELYTRAPLALHAHTTASVALFGDREASVRLVPAVHGVLALLMLFVLVRRHWGDPTAAVVCTLYLLMPINHGFANMANHSTGCFAWGLAALYCYLERRRARRVRWTLALFATFFMALQWDWTAYGVALVVAVHWLYDSFRAGPSLRAEHAVWAAFCAFVLANFAGLFWLAHETVGSLDAVMSSVSARSKSPDGIYARLWAETLAPMFTAPMLALAGLWSLLAAARHVRGLLRARDLIVYAWGFAGTAYVLAFKSTALVHIYWPWPLNLFVALAAGTLVMRLARFAPTRWRTSAELVLATALIVSFASYSVDLIPEGRRMAGTFNHRGYDSEASKIAFSREVERLTTPDTGVLMLRNFKHRAEVVTTLDRVRGWTDRADRIQPPRHIRAVDGWVVVGKATPANRRQRERAAREHPYAQFGEYFVVDYRREGQRVQVWRLAPRERGLAWRFFHSFHEPELVPVPDYATAGRFAVAASRRYSATKQPAPPGRRASRRGRTPAAPAVGVAHRRAALVLARVVHAGVGLGVGSDIVSGSTHVRRRTAAASDLRDGGRGGRATGGDHEGHRPADRGRIARLTQDHLDRAGRGIVDLPESPGQAPAKANPGGPTR